jgi:uncharacterized protein (DUF302 family)
MSTDVTTKRCAGSVAGTVAKLTAMIEARGMTVFATIDQRAAARGAGLDLRDTVLVVFGNPAAGTAVMDAVPLAALDLPLKVLVWADGDATSVSYETPSSLAARHQIPRELAAPLAGIDALTDALVAEEGSGQAPT